MSDNGEAVTTHGFGGDGGEPFDDGYHSTISEITINHGACVDGISILYDDNRAARMWYGGKSGSPSTFKLEALEFITQVTVQASKIIVGLGFQTNQGRKFAPCKGGGLLFLGGKGKNYVVNAPTPGYVLRGVKGRQGKYLDAIAFHWGPAPVAPARVEKSIVGGGGEEFNDGDHERIDEIIINSVSNVFEETVNGVTVIYNDAVISHGRCLGDVSRFSLSQNEFITEVVVQSTESKVEFIGFKTNLGRESNPGGPSGKGTLDVLKPPSPDFVLKGFKGHEDGERLDAIGLNWGPLVQSHGIPDTTPLYGGSGGEPFDDGHRLCINEIYIRSGKVVDGISLLYDFDELVIHGGNRGGEETFICEPDEYITEVTVQAGQYVVSLGFRTNMGRVFDPCTGKGFLTGGSSQMHIVKAPAPNYALKGIKGRQGVYLDAIGFNWGPVD